ncbi:MAG: hypothetical protein ACXWCU_16960 [Caldimonas sp.]
MTHVNAASGRRRHDLAIMENWIDVAQWLGVVAGLLLLAGALVVAVLSWFLNHPD